MTWDIPYRILGRTGEKVSAIGLGGWHIGLKQIDESTSIRLIRSALDRGIKFLDNCWDYNDGASEIRMGKALRDGYRERTFVMRKIDGRSRAEATRQLANRCDAFRSTASTWFSTTRSSAMKIWVRQVP